MRARTVILLIMAVSACGSPQWRHPSKGPADLAKDEAECRVMAKQAGAAASLTGQNVVLTSELEAFNRCLLTKGWNTGGPIAQSSSNQPAAATDLAAMVSDLTFDFQGQKIILPEHSKITRNTLSNLGGVRMQVVQADAAALDSPAQIEILFQKTSPPLKFSPILYPTAPPFFSYATGRLNNGSLWQAFVGRTGEAAWMGGIGTHWVINDEARVIITISTPLPAPDQPPLPGCKITQAQAQPLEALMNYYLTWLNGLGKAESKRNLWDFSNFFLQFDVGQ